MCGVVALINKNKYGFSKEQCDIFNTLLYLSGHFRGTDGTGVVCVDNIGNVQLAKSAKNVPQMQETAEYDAVMKRAFRDGWAMFGHNRAATRGEVKDENSHPFVVDDNIVLIHNGTFTGDHKQLKATEVDSEAIAHVLAEEPNVELALRKVNAAYTLIWYNVGEKKLNLIRNGQRPLFVVETASSFIFASEAEFLGFVVAKYKPTGAGPIANCKEYNLLSYQLEKNKETTEDIVELDCAFYKHVKKDPPSSGPFPVTVVAGGSALEDAAGAARRHALACAWGDLPDDDLDGYPAWEPALSTDTMTGRMKIAKCLTGQFNPVKHMRWKNTIFHDYVMGEEIRVLANDLIEADDHPRTKNYIIMGKTMDVHALPCAFIMNDVEFDRLQMMMANAIFKVTVERVTWQRHDTVEVDNTKPLEEWEGLVVVHTRNPKPVYMPVQNAEENHPSC